MYMLPNTFNKPATANSLCIRFNQSYKKPTNRHCHEMKAD